MLVPNCKQFSNRFIYCKLKIGTGIPSETLGLNTYIMLQKPKMTCNL